jgi:hypothetical protein
MWLFEMYELIIGSIIILAIITWIGKLIFWSFPRLVVEIKKIPGLLKSWIYYILSMISLFSFLFLVSGDIENIFWMFIFVFVPIFFMLILNSPDLDDN